MHGARTATGGRADSSMSGNDKEAAMITLGLMEGALLAGASALVLIGLCTEGAPLHRIFGPVAATLAAIVAVRVATVTPSPGARAVDGTGDVLGLMLAGAVAFAIPIGLFWFAWHIEHPRARVEEPRAELIGAPSRIAKERIAKERRHAA